MMSALFSITPTEAALWNAALSVQTYLSKYVFGTLQFTTIAVTIFAGFVLTRLYKVGRGDSPEGLAAGIIIHLICLGFGFLLLRTVNTERIQLTDSGGGAWNAKPSVMGNSKYKALSRSEDGLYWYTAFHKASTEISLLMLKGLSKNNLSFFRQFLRRGLTV